MHSDLTLEILDQQTMDLGEQFREFKAKVCSAYHTQELDCEVDAQSRRQAKDAAKRVETGKVNNVGQVTAAPQSEPGAIGKGKGKASLEQSRDIPVPKQLQRKKLFNFQTYKFHALGDYVASIHHFGTMDSYSTKPGELEHHTSKDRYRHTDRKAFVHQLTQIEHHQTRLRHIKQRQQGKDFCTEVNEMTNDPEVHHYIGQSEKNYDDIGHYLRSHVHDPAMKHPFVDFNGPECFVLSAYLAHNYRQVSPIYCPDYVSVNSLDGVLPVVGALAIPHVDETLFHTIYKKQFGDGDFLRAIDAHFCRPNGAGMITPVWQLSKLNDIIQFNPAPFPYGFPPPIVTNVSSLPTHFQPNNQLTSVFVPPALLSVGGPAWPCDFDYGYEQEDYPVASLGYAEDSVIPPQDTEMDGGLFGQLAPTITRVFHDTLRWTGVDIAINNDDRSAIKAAMNSTCWRCPIYLMKYFLYGTFWLGLGNLFTTTKQEQRVILTNSFLSAIAHDQTTLQELVNEPAILQRAVAHFPSGTSIRWDIIHLLFSGTIKNRLSDMHKVVQGCTRLDNFSGGGTVQEQEARVKALFDSFNSSDQQDIERAIAELVELYMFGELMWMSTFQTVIGLAEGTRDGRVADLFPQEV
ncbi:uncharacterized protein F5891DRAFT_1203831 [Suillus fuscotomentosus]|uniref:Uncharacterized protein n=1 Tax=Suillus fuscotomentosus TaxID=1912939 RepID=A0AAD4HCM2_9AGAM|nr:uncharacterized protein F5891DRAFT_1203831 [Suillus fuscotomentosus]KAG1882847.1 hypothetical protein F5891DRAFT_1203831 [Suillus fuscotomentosus]